jgi:flagellar assembly protein FliH
MSHNVRFLFDRHFAPLQSAIAAAEASLAAAEADARDPSESGPPLPLFGEEDLERARAEGIAFGREAAAADEERLLRETLNEIAGRLAAALDALSAADVAAAHRASRVAVAIVRKLFPHLQERNAVAEVERIVLTVMARLLDQPELTVRVAAAIRDAVEERLQEVARSQGLEGRFSVAGDTELAVGDCHVTWVGGGVVRDGALLWKEIEAVVEQTFGREIAEELAAGESGKTADRGSVHRSQTAGQVATV